MGHQVDRFSELGTVDRGRNEERALAMKPFELSPPSPALLAVSVFGPRHAFNGALASDASLVRMGL